MRSLLSIPTFHIGPGALGTELQRRGLPLNTAPEAWNLLHPDQVTYAHREYASAGAAWLVTNTFGGTRPRLEGAGLEERSAEVNQRAVELARNASPELPVLASIGPTGRESAADWESAYLEQVEYLAGAGVDGFLIETIIRGDEALAAVRAARACGRRLVIASFTPGPDGLLLDGTSPEDAAGSWRAAGADLVGANCGTGTDSILAAVRRLAAADLGPFYAAPSAGLPLMEEGVARYTLTPDAYARAAIQLRDAGVMLVAGCCGTTPGHVRAARETLAELA